MRCNDRTEGDAGSIHMESAVFGGGEEGVVVVVVGK